MYRVMLETITLVISSLQWQGDENDENNGPYAVWWQNLHFTVKYLYNNISSYHKCEIVDLIT